MYFCSAEFTQKLNIFMKCNFIFWADKKHFLNSWSIIISDLLSMNIAFSKQADEV